MVGLYICIQEAREAWRSCFVPCIRVRFPK